MHSERFCPLISKSWAVYGCHSNALKYSKNLSLLGCHLSWYSVERYKSGRTSAFWSNYLCSQYCVCDLFTLISLYYCYIKYCTCYCMCIGIKCISKINRNIIMEFVLSWPEKIVYGIFSSVKIQVYFMNLNVNESLRLN